MDTLANEFESTAPKSLNQEISVISQKDKFSEKSFNDLRDITEALRIFDLSSIKYELAKVDETLLLNIEIDGIWENLRQSELQKSSKKCKNKSIVVLLSSKNHDKFSLYWKSKEIPNFLIISPYSDTPTINDKHFYDFLAKFLAESLAAGNLGLLSSIQKSADKGGNVELHLIADHRDFNLLFLAAEMGKNEIFKILLKQNLETVLYRGNDDLNAQDLAWEHRHDDIVLTLLKFGATFPKKFDINASSPELRKFCEISEELHSYIIKSDENKIKEILNSSDFPHPFYNRLNESAAKLALNNKLINIYQVLTTRKVFLGRHEVFHEFWGNFTEVEREMLRKIHFKNSVHMPEKHLTGLVNSSSVSHDDKNVKSNLNLVQYAFGILNQNPFIRIILMIVAASKKLQIIFDFKSTTIDVVDPTADSNTRGLFYTKGVICVAAGFLINQSTENETFGTLAHELCHYAMNLVYRNRARPYSKKDQERRREFATIVKLCEQNRAKEILIDLALRYPQHMHHAELIVRVPHLMALYHNQPEKLKETRENFKELFEFYEKNVVADIEKALPRIEKEIQHMERKILKNKIISIVTIILSFIVIVAGFFITRSIFYNPVYKFSDLSNDDQTKIRNSSVHYKNVEIQFQDLFNQNSPVYHNLTSDHISQMLSGEPLYFSDPHSHYLDSQVKHIWKNLTKKLKDKFLSSNLIFQNESIEFKELYLKSPNAFLFLSSEQITNVLDGDEMLIDQMISNQTKFFVERSFRDEKTIEIFWSFIDKTPKHKDSEERFREYFDNFISQNVSVYNDEISKIEDSSSFVWTTLYSYDEKYEPLLSFASFNEDFEEILENAESSKMFILSSEAGTGKSTTFEQFTIRIKEKYTTHWVSLIDLKDHISLYNRNDYITDVFDLLEEIFELKTISQFERKIFKELYESGKVFLLWNGFDEISPTYSEFILKILKTIQENTTNVQFVCTRPLYSNKLRETLHIRPYTLIPFTDKIKFQFLWRYFEVVQIDSEYIFEYVKKVYQIVHYLREKVFGNEHREDFNTPLMLEMVAELISDDEEIYESENLWQIYEKFIKKKIDIWDSKSKFAQKFAKSSFTDNRRFDMMRLYQMFALKSEIPNYNYYASPVMSMELKILHQNIPKELTSDEISRMGILYINGPKNVKFVHRTFAEFFIAQFLIENIFIEDDIDSENAEIIIDIFASVIENYEWLQILITNFIEYFLKTEKSHEHVKFNPKIIKLFKSEFSKIFFDFLQSTKSSVFEFSFKFFKKDHNLLVNLLHVHENETVYTAAFNRIYFHYGISNDLNHTMLMNLAKSYLSEKEFEKFTNGKNQKGIILFSLYLFYRDDLKTENTRSVFHNHYDLDEKILDNSDKFQVLELIAKNLTESELKELFLSSSSPLTYNGYDLVKTDKFWIMLNNFLTDQEKKIFILNLIHKISMMDFYSNYLPFITNKVNEILSTSEILDLFLNKNILHLSASRREIKTFEDFWKFFQNHTNGNQQKEMLLREIDKECYEYNFFRNRKCYNFPPFNILQIMLIFQRNNDNKVINAIQFYEKYFEKSEIQEIILKSNDFLLHFIGQNDYLQLRDFANYMSSLFSQNKTLLSEFLLRNVSQVNMNIFEYFENIRHYSGKLEPFSKLLE